LKEDPFLFDYLEVEGSKHIQDVGSCMQSTLHYIVEDWSHHHHFSENLKSWQWLLAL